MMKRIHLCARKLFRAGLAVLLVGVLAVGVLEAKDNGDKDFKKGKAAEDNRDWDIALDFYTKALDKAPNNQAFMIALRRARFEAGQLHVNRGQKLRTDGKLEESLVEFQRAFLSDPASTVALQEIRRTEGMLKENQAGVRPQDRTLTLAERARKEIEERVNSIQGPPELKPVLPTLPNGIKMNNQPPKVLYETVGKMAGINVVFDSQYSAPSRNFNVDLMNNPSVEQAFDYLAVLTHTYWKPISSNTIFVTEDNVTKRRDYEDQVVKVFYITNATSQQEFQEISSAVRTVAEIRRVFTYNAQKAMVVRGPADAVALAEKLVHDLDKPKSEVIVDVIVMQVNSERTKSLAATIANSGTAGLQMSATFLPSTTNNSSGTPSTSSGSIGLGRLAHLGISDWQTSLPGAILNFIMSDSRTKTMNKPQIRASDGMKATLKIGQRIPYATGSYQAGVAATTVSPLVSTQFQYADVGVTIDMTPQVHSAQEVTLHIEVTVSSVQQYVNVGGISQPIIQQSVNTADVRLRDGEVNTLGGLSQSIDSHTLNGLPGLTDIPVLGKFLFGGTTSDKINGELMIALVPHIVRTPDYTAENLRGIYAGTDQSVKLYYAPKTDGPKTDKDGAQAPAAVPPAASVPAPAQPAPAKPSPDQSALPPGAPAAAVPQTPMPAPQIPVTAPPPSPGAPAPPAGQARLRFGTQSVEGTPGAPISVAVQVENAADLSSADPIHIKFDPSQLKLNDMAPGELFTRDGQRVTSVKDIRNDSGEAILTVARPPGSAGVTGTGSIVTLNFTATGKGSSTISFPGLTLKNAQSQLVAITPAELPVKIQ